jgi:energy-coupling factor transport system permease protein
MAKKSNMNILSNLDRDSWFHKLDPRTKIFLLMSFGIVPLFFTDPRVILFFILLCLPFWLTANLDYRPMIAPFLGVGIMLFVVFFFNVIRPLTDLENTGAVSSWSFAIGPIMITSYSVTRALFLSGRLVVPLTVGLLIIVTTDPSYLAKGLRKIGIPIPIVFMALSALRFIPIVMDQLQHITDAMSIRGVVNSRRVRTQLMILPLFITSLRRTRTMGLASEAKGFGAGLWNNFYEEFRLSRYDNLLIIGLAFMTLISIVLRFGFGFGAGFYIPAGSR